MRVSKQLDKLKSSDDFADDRGLTKKEKRYCYEYVKDHKTSVAAKRAGISYSAVKDMMKRPRVKDFIDHLETRNELAALENEPEMLKGQRGIWANSNMKDYFDGNRFIGWDNLTSEQASCIKKITYGHTSDGFVYLKSLELYDADRSNEILAKPHGIYSPISIDLDLLDLIDPGDFEKLAKKYGWGIDVKK